MHEHPFEKALSVSVEDIEFALRGHQATEWADFLLNPRRLRGSDFLMRWSQGYWSEERLLAAVQATEDFYAIPYGPSGVAPKEVREFELYFERLEEAGMGQSKRPDLLIFRAADRAPVDAIVDKIGGLEELPFAHEATPEMQQLLKLALLAIECENSLWVAGKMPKYNAEMRPQKRLGGKLGLAKTAVLPNVIIKDEDFALLQNWQDSTGVPIHIWHAFFDMAFGLSLDRATELVEQGFIEPTIQIFQAPAGATTKKAIYKFYYHYAYPLATTQDEVTLQADKIIDANGHILPYVRFEGGRLQLQAEALQVLENAANEAST